MAKVALPVNAHTEHQQGRTAGKAEQRTNDACGAGQKEIRQKPDDRWNGDIAADAPIDRLHETAERDLPIGVFGLRDQERII